mmetsp:Transcript_8364/g.17965  ORF Transcript_8364/g.17965 Transcript_8364/m.17965 type:complete len:924 (+) Transcript_8364:111-2882(+)|eukprot:CAMPEP_0185856948 /NCGR_PEP_ID=MMETSP1354-20130828/29252_1 /TAXON_ID=708628 /ORGANISM="Erythrolobus madagascarensis, Strain CCMP3276" /LENGTH=923 /DNA_ID=CAMNT_0028559209 /DNA_START=97 /DNA_END=2868 /DNA_ORIENTATION=+
MDDRKYKDEDAGWGYAFVSPFEGIQKGQVLQECRCFNDRQLDADKCEEALTRLLYLVTQGEKLSSDEATTVFFSVTKLFQSSEESLRRLVYLAIKELAHTAEEVIIVTNCLTKDINSDIDMYRANATRVLCKITDAQMVQAIERYLKQEIVDRNPYVASSSLVSAQSLIANNKGDVVRRWVNEIAQAMEHANPMVQYHALALLYAIKQNDKLAVSKLVQQLVRNAQRTPLATCMLVRLVGKLISDQHAANPVPAGTPRPLFDFLEACLRHRSDMVVHEAAKVIVDLPDVSASELQPVVNVLQLFLVQSKTIMRFAAMRLFNRIAFTHPGVLAAVNGDMEQLLQDSNRSVSTLAITALLRTCSESSIERLLKQIHMFMPELGDEFKTKIVEAVNALCAKYPAKQYALMNFLGAALREEGGYEFKKTIVNSYLAIMVKMPETKETCLTHLSEFIEDCEHSSLSTRVLHVLGEHGPSMPEPGKFIRYIYNRLILENSTVRAAAVSALACFASTGDAKMRRSVVVLVQQSLADHDDEVRDRASFYVKALGLDLVMEAMKKKESSDDMLPVLPAEDLYKLPCPVQNLEADLLRYVGSGATQSCFDLSSVSKAALPSTARSAAAATAPSVGGLPDGMGGEAGAVAEATNGTSAVQEIDPAERLGKSRGIVELGFVNRPFKSCMPPVELTEEGTEYEVKCVKHVFENAVVLEFTVVNTLEDQVLENLVVEVDVADMEGVGEVKMVPAPHAKFNEPESAFTVLFCSAPGELYVNGGMTCTLKYTMKEVDSATGEADEDGYEDDYQLEDLTVSIGDMIALPGELPRNFKAAWDAIGDVAELSDSFALGAHETVAAAVSAVVQFLSMAPCEGTDRVSDRAREHVLLMAGLVAPNVQALVRAQFQLQPEGGVALNLLIRSESEAVSNLIASCIA